jgi:hypothetical protein
VRPGGHDRTGVWKLLACDDFDGDPEYVALVVAEEGIWRGSGFAVALGPHLGLLDRAVEIRTWPAG